MPLSNAEPVWLKLGDVTQLVYIGGNVIAANSTIYVYFFNLTTREKRIEKFASEERTDGVSFLAGHAMAPIFSVAEKRLDPKISVFTYPSLRKISVCSSDKKTTAYLCCAFAGCDYFLAQTSLPDFRLIVWNWRTGEKITDIATMTNRTDEPVILCSQNNPIQIGILARASGKLDVYRLLVSPKLSRLYPIEIATVPEGKIVSFCWTPQDHLLCCNDLGAVYSMNLLTSQSEACAIVMKYETPNRQTPVITSCQGGILLATVDRDGKSWLTLIRKVSELPENGNENGNGNGNANDWRIGWTVPLPSQPTWMACRPGANQGIIIHSGHKQVIQVLPPTRDRAYRLDILHTDEKRSMDLIGTSIGDHCIALLNIHHRFFLLNPTTGRRVSSDVNLKHHGEVVRMESHTSLPIVATCSETGNCLFIDGSDGTCPKIKGCFHLQKGRLDHLKFSNRVTLLGACGSKDGRIFLIGTHRNRNYGNLGVLGLLKVGGQVADFLIDAQENNEKFRVLALVASMPHTLESTATVGKRILIFSCDPSTEFHAHVTRLVELATPFESLYYSGGKTEEIIGIPYLSKQLHRISLQRGNDDVNFILKEALPSLHHTRKTLANVSHSSYIVTYGYDGMVVIRDSKEPRMVLGIVATHHRNAAGVARAIIVGNILLSLGRNGDLLACRLATQYVDNYSETDKEAAELQIQDLTISDTWLDNMNREKIKAEKDDALPTRLSIIAGLESIKTTIKKLLDDNEMERTESRLPISMFDLDKDGRREKIEEAMTQEEKLQKRLEEEIASQNSASSYLYENFVKPLIVQPVVISAISGQTKLENYPMSTMPDNEIHINQSENLSYIGEFHSEEDEERDFLENGCLVEETARIKENLFRPPAEHFSSQKINSLRLISENIIKLKFNKLFDEISQCKKDKLKEMTEQVESLKKCISELHETFNAELETGVTMEHTKYLGEFEDLLERESLTASQCSIDSVSSIASSARWRPISKEEVNSDEDSPGNRREFFWEDALQRMMDGMLEVRWQDELKKDIPKPECLMRKDPSKYTEEDVAIIAEYQAKVQALQDQRNKYKYILETEIVGTREKTWASIREFDNLLEALARKKIHAERSVLRCRLTAIRMVAAHRELFRGKCQISRFNDEELVAAARESRMLTEECDLFEAAVGELKCRYDNLCKREKQQESKFRSEFSGLKEPMVEHLFRHFKRRPRIDSIASTSITYFSELANCLINKSTSEILPREYLDLLRDLNSLDALPDSLPAQIDPASWRTMCKLRRGKIETEIKVKSCAAELVQAEQSLSFCRRISQTARIRMSKHKDKLRELEEALRRSKCESEIGLVLKTGQVEIELSGNPSDTEDAVLVLREELHRANGAIVTAGEMKLTVLRNSIELEKEICREEWRHASLKLKMKDLREYLEDLQSTKVMRIGRQHEKPAVITEILNLGAVKAEKNLRLMKERLEKKFREEKSQLTEVTKQIELWRKKNNKLTKLIKKYELESEEVMTRSQDPQRLREAHFKRKTIHAIAKQLTLAKKIRENTEEIIGLRAHLEICKLRTFPTLRLQH